MFEGTASRSSRSTSSASFENVIGPQPQPDSRAARRRSAGRTGVIAGMSGSPVYVDGRLIGAVSYSLGQFPKEPIAGITPIDEMIDATAAQAPSAGTAPARGRRFRSRRPRWPRPSARPLHARRRFARSEYDVRFSGEHGRGLERHRSSARCCGRSRRRWSSAGFAGDTADLLVARVPRAASSPIVGRAGPRARLKRRTARSARRCVGVSLVTGDLELGATGTVTHVDGDRVYAFGHPFYNLGPTEFPMTRAYVYVVLPSLLSSMKIASLGDVIGTFQQDRATAIAGTLGTRPGDDAGDTSRSSPTRRPTRRSTSASSTISCSRRC